MEMPYDIDDMIFAEDYPAWRNTPAFRHAALHCLS